MLPLAHITEVSITALEVQGFSFSEQCHSFIHSVYILGEAAGHSSQTCSQSACFGQHCYRFSFSLVTAACLEFTPPDVFALGRSY